MWDKHYIDLLHMNNNRIDKISFSPEIFNTLIISLSSRTKSKIGNKNLSNLKPNTWFKLYTTYLIFYAMNQTPDKK